jgi:membrane-associated phospholipid phosphatase
MHRRSLRPLAVPFGVLSVSCVSLGPRLGRAQPAATAAVDTTAHRAAERADPLLGTRRLLVDVGVTAVAGAAVAPFDVRLQRAVRARAVQRSRGLRGGARVADAAGDPGTLVAAVALYGGGLLAGRPHVAALGLHAGEAIVASGVVTGGLKLLVGRQRPNVEPGDADDFVPARGDRAGRTSFPSGHTTAAFAFASAAAADLRRWSPRAGRVATPLLYAGAASVGLARMYDDRHWASDVVVGAGIGMLAGARVAAYARAHPDHVLERGLLRLTIAPSAAGRGVAVGLHAATR